MMHTSGSNVARARVVEGRRGVMNFDGHVDEVVRVQWNE